MDSISVLRYCASVLLVREVTDHEGRWQWAIRRKVANWALRRALRRAGQVPDPVALSAAECRQLEATHPWLQPIVPIQLPALPCEDVSRTPVTRRVAAYEAALLQRASGFKPADVRPSSQ